MQRNMIQILDKRLCTGCGACVIACPTGAIEMKADAEGFEYPFVDIKKCVNCGKCDQVCHMRKTPKENDKAEYYAGYLKQSELLETVSSGGAAWALTLAVLQSGGIVYGAVQERVDFVRHMRAETIEEAQKFRRSKYLPSALRNCYREAKTDLDQGRTVLFTGTACQIAGLYAYLETDYDNLYTCDVICHGIPSVTVFQKYREEAEKIYKSEIRNIIFRNKSFGWRRNHYKIELADGRSIFASSRTHIFHSGYLQGLFSRRSCGDCRYAAIPRISDITLADFWKYEGELKETNQNRGISLILCNSKKGKKLFEQAAEAMYVEQSTETAAVRSCRHLTKTPKENGKRKKFFDLLNQKGYRYAARACTPRRIILYDIIERTRSRFYGNKKETAKNYDKDS